MKQYAFYICKNKKNEACKLIYKHTVPNRMYPSAGRPDIFVFLHSIDENSDCTRCEIHITVQCKNEGIFSL